MTTQAPQQPQYKKPLPRATAESQPFWAACKRHEVVFQKCRKCGKARHYPQPLCPNCHSFEYEWIKSTGKGKVHSYTIAHRAFHPGFEGETPYVIVIVDMEEGVRMMGNTVGIKPEEVKVGMPLEVLFEDVTPEFSIPKFKKAGT